MARPISKVKETTMRRRILHAVAAPMLLLATSLPVRAGGDPADGDLDLAFRDGGKFSYNTPSMGGEAVAVAPDGRLLIGYSVHGSGTDYDMRLLPVPDSGTAFHCGTYAPDLGGSEEDLLADIAVDGNIVYLAGSAAGPADDPTRRAAVGAVDLEGCSILPFGGPEGALRSSALGLRAVGVAVTGGGEVRVASERGPVSSEELHTYGLDTAGDPDGGFTSQYVDFNVAFGAVRFEPHGMERQPDGKLLVVGTIELGDGDKDVAVARFTAGGALDSTFSGDGLLAFSYDIVDLGADEGWAVTVLPDRRIAVGGCDYEGAGDIRAAVAVLTPTGGYFNDFGLVGRYRFTYVEGLPNNDCVLALAAQGDGKIVAAGGAATGTHDFGIARLLGTGAAPLDASFHLDGRRVVVFNEGGALIDIPRDLTLGQGGKISVAGVVSTDLEPAVGALRLWNSYIFADGFEWGSTHFWNQPAP
jgi:uncharacterized delta-60 repeat protein